MIKTESANAPLAHFEFLEQALPDIFPTVKKEIVSRPKISSIVTAKSRMNAFQMERNQFRTVIGHPVFQKDPSQAIHTHLMMMAKADAPQ